MVAVSDRLLHLGCGGRVHPAWVNADLNPVDDGVVRLDASGPLPFADASFDAVYHAHLIEHLSRDAAERMLGECFRVLRGGGVLRVVTPDLGTIAANYLESLRGALAGEAGASERYEWAVLELLDQLVRTRSGGRMMRHMLKEPVPAEGFVRSRMGLEMDRLLDAARSQRSGDGRWPAWCGMDEPADEPDASREAAFRAGGEIHRWMYDRWSLPLLLVSAGFTGPRCVGPEESAIEGWAGYGFDAGADGVALKPDSMFFECERPG